MILWELTINATNIEKDERAAIFKELNTLGASRICKIWGGTLSQVKTTFNGVEELTESMWDLVNKLKDKYVFKIEATKNGFMLYVHAMPGSTANCMKSAKIEKIRELVQQELDMLATSADASRDFRRIVGLPNSVKCAMGDTAVWIDGAKPLDVYKQTYKDKVVYYIILSCIADGVSHAYSLYPVY